MICKFLNLQHYSCPLQKEIFRRVFALYSHWNLTTAYIVAGHEQKYHYRCAYLRYHQKQSDFRHISIYRSLSQSKRSWRTYVTARGITSAQLMYLKIWYSVFKEFWDIYPSITLLGHLFLIWSAFFQFLQ